METIYILFLYVHIISGFAALLAGLLNLLRKKGDAWHLKAGRLFVYAMLIAGFSSLFLSVYIKSFFLFITGVFSIYLVGTGQRYLYLKRLNKGQKPKTVDWLLTLSMLVAGLFFAGLGIGMLMGKSLMGLTHLTFGFIGLTAVYADFQSYKGKDEEPAYWLLAHLQRMTGAFIAALTAFLVVNAHQSPVALPAVVYWLLPTAILVPLIFYWSAKYRSRSE